jgi:hypothetical protein
MAAILVRILHPIVCLRRSVMPPTLIAAERSLRDNRSAAMSLVYYFWAKAPRSLFSCSSGRFVEMISKSYCLSSSITLSGAVAPLVKANKAEVPSVTFSLTCLMKSSSIPTSAKLSPLEDHRAAANTVD